MKIRSAITILIAFAWMSTQIAMGFAHGTSFNDHHGTVHQSASSQQAAHHHSDLEQSDTEEQNLHSHMKKQLNDSNGLSALQACDSSCAAIFVNSWTATAIDMNRVNARPVSNRYQSFIELQTPPPNNLL